MTQAKIFPIAGHEYKIYPIGYGAATAMNYAFKKAFQDIHGRTPGQIDMEQSEQAGETVWAVKPADELEAFKAEYADHPRTEFRIAEQLLIPVDPKHPFTEETFYTANPAEVAEALGFFITSLPTNEVLPIRSKPASRQRGTSKASTK